MLGTIRQVLREEARACYACDQNDEYPCKATATNKEAQDLEHGF